MIAIHGGAGYFKTDEHMFCAEAIKKSEYNMIKAVMMLERNVKFNCGLGSNLTMSGRVECEAAYMTSCNLAFGAVGCVTNCANPVFAAKSLAQAYKHSNGDDDNDWQLIPPIVLIGQGADAYCANIFPPSAITENNQQLKTLETIKDHTKALKLAQQFKNGKLDTVGGVVIHLDNSAEACVSSGGIMLKHDGRLGHCCQFGAGIWAEKSAEKSVAVSLSGCGEALFRTHLAEKIAELVLQRVDNNTLIMDKIYQFLLREFVNSPKLKCFPHDRKLFGGLMLVKTNERTELIIFHNTSNFVYAYSVDKMKVRRGRSYLSAYQDILCQSFTL